MINRWLAYSGLSAALLVMVLAMGVLARQAIINPHPTIEIGKIAPVFTLPDTAGHLVSLADYRGRAVVLFFGSDVNPVSKQYAERMAELTRQYANDSRVKFLAIDSNTNARAANTANLKLIHVDRIPTLLDPMATVARSYGATVTPTFCVIDAAGNLQYAGAFDDGQAEPDGTGEFCANALQHTINGVPVAISSTQAFGQSINWLK